MTEQTSQTNNKSEIVLIKKKIYEKHNNRYFLLGRRKQDKQLVYLQGFEWDCNWYWGGGYLEVLDMPHGYFRDIAEHTHFDDTFFGKSSDVFIKEFWIESPLTENERWILFDLMKQFFSLKKCAESYLYGGHQTNKAFRFEKIHAKEMNTTINNDIKLIIGEIESILTPDDQKDSED